MKKFLSEVTLAFLLLFVSSCNNEVDNITGDELEIVSIENMNFSSLGGVGTITVANGNSSINVFSNKPWCQAEVDGSIIKITVEAYDGYESRTALVTVMTGDNRKMEYPVIQEALNVDYNIDKLAYTISNNSTVINIDINTIEKIKAEVKGNAKAWILSEVTEKGVKLTVSKNSSGIPRYGILDVDIKGRKYEYKILQYDLEDLTSAFAFWGLDETVPQTPVKKLPFKVENGDIWFDFSEYAKSELKLKAVLNEKDGGYRIYAGEKVGTINDYSIISYIISEDFMNLYPMASIDLKPMFLLGGNLAFTFSDNGSFPNNYAGGMIFLLSRDDSYTGVDQDLGAMILTSWQLAHESLFQN